MRQAPTGKINPAPDRSGGGLAVLDLYGHPETGPPGRRWPVCPRKGHVKLVNSATGVVTTGRCRVLTCHACIWPEALNFGAAIGLAKPRWLGTITQVGSAWPEIQRRMKHFRKALNRARVQVEYAWHVEPNPGNERQHHVHFWAHGSSLPKAAVSAAAISAGAGAVADVTPTLIADTSQVPTLAYGMKACRPPHPDVTSLWPEAQQFLDANGGSLGHSTAGFWRDTAGSPLGTRREATRLARSEQGRGEWIVSAA